MGKLSPSRVSERQWECKMGKKYDDDGADLLIRWAWGGLRTESPLCCPGWNFVLEKCLTFSNPNCTQWGVSSFPLPTGLVTVLLRLGLRRRGGCACGDCGGINRMEACLFKRGEVKLGEGVGWDSEGYRYLSGNYPWHLGSQAATFKHMI